jgi:hypothetical protein
MVAQEQHMSEAKRDHSAFQHTAAAGRAMASARSSRPGAEPGKFPNFADLRLLDSWEDRAVSGGDPYNGIGVRAFACRSLRK